MGWSNSVELSLPPSLPPSPSRGARAGPPAPWCYEGRLLICCSPFPPSLPPSLPTLEILIGEDKLIRFSGCKSGAACSVVLRGASAHLLDEAERSLHDALCVLSQTVRETRTIPGGGCAEVAMAQVGREGGRVCLAVSGTHEIHTHAC